MGQLFSLSKVIDKTALEAMVVKKFSDEVIFCWQFSCIDESIFAANRYQGEPKGEPKGGSEG